MKTKQPDFAELNTLAIEACDMWQEHLSTLATDPMARAELTRFLEPQRRLFADWVSMMQQGTTTGAPSGSPAAAEDRHDTSKPAQSHAATSAPDAEAIAAKPHPASRDDEHGDDALRVAQLAYRVAELEKRLAQLESAAGGNAGAARRTQRTTP